MNRRRQAMAFGHVARKKYLFLLLTTWFSPGFIIEWCGSMSKLEGRCVSG